MDENNKPNSPEESLKIGEIIPSKDDPRTIKELSVPLDDNGKERGFAFVHITHQDIVDNPILVDGLTTAQISELDESITMNNGALDLFVHQSHIRGMRGGASLREDRLILERVRYDLTRGKFQVGSCQSEKSFVSLEEWYRYHYINIIDRTRHWPNFRETTDHIKELVFNGLYGMLHEYLDKLSDPDSGQTFKLEFIKRVYEEERERARVVRSVPDGIYSVLRGGSGSYGITYIPSGEGRRMVIARGKLKPNPAEAKGARILARRLEECYDQVYSRVSPVSGGSLTDIKKEGGRWYLQKDSTREWVELNLGTS